MTCPPPAIHSSCLMLQRSMQYSNARDYGFPGKVEAYVEKGAYPHRSRATVGEVPAPHYTMQDRFNPDNYAFKGYGTDAKVPPKGSCPFGVDLHNDERFVSHRPSQVCPVALREPAPVSNAASLNSGLIGSHQFHTRIELASVPRARSSNPQQQALQQPSARQDTTPARVARGQQSAGSQIASIFNMGGANDTLGTPRPLTRGGPPVRPTSAAGRPTSAASSRDAHLFDKELPPEEMQAMLQRCGSVFDGLNNAAVFSRVWLHASGGVNPARLVSVSKFRQSIDALGL